MLTRRKLLIAFGLSTLQAPPSSWAQQPAKVRRIGALTTYSSPTPSNPNAFYDAFTQGMRELGYVEGKNLVIEWRFADGKCRGRDRSGRRVFLRAGAVDRQTGIDEQDAGNWSL